MTEHDIDYRIDVVRDGSNVTIDCEGELDLHNYKDLHEGLIEGSSTAESITVDLVKVAYIDTAVLASLARAATKMMARGKSLHVKVKEGSHPLRTLQITGFSTVVSLTIVPKETPTG